MPINIGGKLFVQPMRNLEMLAIEHETQLTVGSTKRHAHYKYIQQQTSQDIIIK